MSPLKTLAFLLPAFALAACNSEPAPEPQPTQVATPEPVNTLPAPNEALFAKLYAETCPSSETVSTSSCKRAGMGSKDVICQYGLGDDEYLRNTATLTAGDDAWTIADSEKICAQHG